MSGSIKRPDSPTVTPSKETNDKMAGLLGIQPQPMPAIQIIFDFSREGLLTIDLPVLSQHHNVAAGNTVSTHGVYPDYIAEWHQFPQEVIQYWATQVTQNDKAAMIHSSQSIGLSLNTYYRQRAWDEEVVRTALWSLPFTFHRVATRDDSGQPRPSDQHSDIISFQPGWNFLGRPDYFFHSPPQRRITAVVDAKKPWSVTPLEIDAVLNGTAGASSSGRLAVEQVYGYMKLNQKVFGIITTMTGWMFLKREDGGRLFMTRMFACISTPPAPPQQGLLQPGYTHPVGFTIMMALYYFSSLAERTPDLPETGNPQAAASQANWGAQQNAQQMQYQTTFTVGGQHMSSAAQYGQQLQWSTPTQYWNIVFEPWKTGTQLGHKTWIGNLDGRSGQGDGKVVLKLWDSWRSGPEDRDNEVAVYHRLQSLWGLCIPTLHAFGPLEFSHSLVIDYIDNASHVSSANLTVKIQQKIVQAFDRIHSLGVLHGDLRPENILVGPDGDVWIIDFEFSRIAAELPGAGAVFAKEHGNLVQMLTELNILA